VPFWNRNSSYGIVNKLRIDNGGTTVRFPAGKDIFLFSETSRPAMEAHPTSYSLCTSGYFPHRGGRGEQLGRKADHSQPPNAEVKNEWSYTSTFQICIYGVQRDNLPVVCPSSHICYSPKLMTCAILRLTIRHRHNLEGAREVNCSPIFFLLTKSVFWLLSYRGTNKITGVSFTQKKAVDLHSVVHSVNTCEDGGGKHLYHCMTFPVVITWVFYL